MLALFVHDCINYVIDQAQGNECPSVGSPMRRHEHGLVLKCPSGSKIPCGMDRLNCGLGTPVLCPPTAAERVAEPAAAWGALWVTSS